MAQFKIALTAGHYLYTVGKRCLKSLDPGETREWVLNNRIADRVLQLLEEHYTGYQLLRTDDTTGETDRTLEARVGEANRWGADFYLSIHHNAGVNGGKGGGIVSIVYTDPQPESVAWQKELYDALIAATGLKGDRAEPLAKMDMFECRETAMPAVMLELGFMDSATDVPVILSAEFAERCAGAIVEVLARRGKLQPRSGRYQALWQVPDYGRATVEKLRAEGWLVGNGAGLDLSEDMVRILTILDRAGIFERGSA